MKTYRLPRWWNYLLRPVCWVFGHNWKYYTPKSGHGMSEERCAICRADRAAETRATYDSD
jgi:hypothetical protein